jgi:hypothetical protein
LLDLDYLSREGLLKELLKRVMDYSALYGAMTVMASDVGCLASYLVSAAQTMVPAFERALDEVSRALAAKVISCHDGEDGHEQA